MPGSHSIVIRFCYDLIIIIVGYLIVIQIVALCTRVMTHCNCIVITGLLERAEDCLLREATLGDLVSRVSHAVGGRRQNELPVGVRRT